jgi:hypothetical protein
MVRKSPKPPAEKLRENWFDLVGGVSRPRPPNTTVRTWCIGRFHSMCKQSYLATSETSPRDGNHLIEMAPWTEGQSARRHGPLTEVPTRLANAPRAGSDWASPTTTFRSKIPSWPSCPFSPLRAGKTVDLPLPGGPATIYIWAAIYPPKSRSAPSLMSSGRSFRTRFPCHR